MGNFAEFRCSNSSLVFPITDLSVPAATFSMSIKLPFILLLSTSMMYGKLQEGGDLVLRALVVYLASL